MEAVASMLRRDACRIIKTTLAGLAAGKLVDVIKATFGGEEREVEHEALEEVFEEDNPKEDLPTDQPSSSRGTKQKGSTSSTSVSKHQISHPSKGGIVPLKDATPYHPTVKDKKGYHHAGVNPRFYSKWKSSLVYNMAGYSCLYSEVKQGEGEGVPPCEFFSMVKSQLSTHICQHHLGIVVTCFICSGCWWSGTSWYDHMENKHSTLKEEDFFLREGAEGELKKLKQMIIKKEVNPEDV